LNIKQLLYDDPAVVDLVPQALSSFQGLRVGTDHLIFAPLHHLRLTLQLRKHSLMGKKLSNEDRKLHRIVSDAEYRAR
jgi:hypothetical protein